PRVQGRPRRLALAATAMIGVWLASRAATESALGTSASYALFFLLGYLFDVGWARQQPATNAGPFLAGALSFTYVPSGPGPNVKPDLEQILKGVELTMDVLREAGFRILLGLCKKSLADVLVAQALRASQGGVAHGTVSVWIEQLFLAARLYADF